MISQQDNEKTIIHQRVTKAKGELTRNEVKLPRALLGKSCARRKNKRKVKLKLESNRKLKIVNKNQNLQVVNMKLGCVNKRSKRLILKKKKCTKLVPRIIPKVVPQIVQRVIRKTIRVPAVAKADRNLLKERICVDFLVRESTIPQRLWTAIGVTPIGSLVLDNKSPSSVTLIVHQSHGEVITQEVKPQTELALSVFNLVLIEVTCHPLHHKNHAHHLIHAHHSNQAYHPNHEHHPKHTHTANHSTEKCTDKHTSCFGALTLDLFIPFDCGSESVKKKVHNLM